MQHIHYERFQMDVYSETLDNGLTVYLIPKPGFQQVFSMFTTKYGSMNQTFRLQGEKDYTIIPDGVAHFLEHKMFEKETGDVFNDFAVNGASANAFTSFDQTTYLFSCTENVEENTRTLLDFVQRPYFTDENVEKEKGIIGQEIRMYDDNPDWRCFFNLLKGLYQNHPVRIDIAGTVESIAQITKESLYRCYGAFYHPSNMVYVSVGGFNPAQLMKVIRENQALKLFDPIPVIEHQFPDEPEYCFEPKIVTPLGVAQPRCLIGWKDASIGKFGSELLRQELITGLILDSLFGRSSRLFDELVESQLIDQQFTWEYEICSEYGYALVGGNTPAPDKLVERVDAELASVMKTGIDQADFERNRKKTLGRFMAGLDQSNYIARSFSSYCLKGVNFFETVDILEQVTIDEANARLKEYFIPAYQSVSIISKKS